MAGEWRHAAIRHPLAQSGGVSEADSVVEEARFDTLLATIRKIMSEATGIPWKETVGRYRTDDRS